jgi:hypothetical protein
MGYQYEGVGPGKGIEDSYEETAQDSTYPEGAIPELLNYVIFNLLIFEGGSHC